MVWWALIKDKTNIETASVQCVPGAGEYGRSEVGRDKLGHEHVQRRGSCVEECLNAAELGHDCLDSGVVACGGSLGGINALEVAGVEVEKKHREEQLEHRGLPVLTCLLQLAPDSRDALQPLHLRDSSTVAAVLENPMGIGSKARGQQQDPVVEGEEDRRVARLGCSREERPEAAFEISQRPLFARCQVRDVLKWHLEPSGGCAGRPGAPSDQGLVVVADGADLCATLALGLLEVALDATPFAG